MDVTSVPGTWGNQNTTYSKLDDWKIKTKKKKKAMYTERLTVGPINVIIAIEQNVNIKSWF